MRVLLVEDDKRIAEPLSSALERAGFRVDHEQDGEAGWVRGDTEDYDVIVLDLGLPGMDGLTVLKRWRKAGRKAPVLILTARSQWEERVDGIEAGADDYVVKPFHTMEVIARLRALVRRAAGHASSRVPFGRYLLDLNTMQVLLDDLPIELSPQEFKLVALLVRNRGRVLSQQEIIEHIYHQDVDRDSNVIEVLVARVRKRLSPDVISTRRGFGYLLGEGF